MKTKLLSLSLCAAVMTMSYVCAAPGDSLANFALSGTTSNDKWTNLNGGANPGYGSFPGSGAWPAPIASNVGDDAVLAKIGNGTGGGPYPASGSIYFGGFSGDANVNGGTLAVQDSTPLADLANVVFQIEIGEASTYDFFNDVLPALSYVDGTGTHSLAASISYISNQVFNGTVTMPTGEEPLYINTYVMQWDFTGISDVSSFKIEFTGVQHAQLYSLQLDQSTVFSAVPEPSTYAAIFGGLALIGAVVRRRMKGKAA